MRETDKQQVLQLLGQRQLVNPQVLQQTIQEANQTKVDVLQLLVNRRLVPEEELAQLKSQVIGIPYVNLGELEVDPSVLNRVPMETAQTYSAVAFAQRGPDLDVAMMDPHDFKAVEALDFVARRDGLRIVPYICSHASLLMALKQYETVHKEVAKALERAELEPDALLEVAETETENVKTAPVSKMVSVILRNAVEGNSSDVHIEPMTDHTRVRYRMDGVLHTSLMLPRNVHNAIVSRIKVMANLKLDETRLPQDGRFRMRIEGREVDFRVSTMPLMDKEKVVMRILDSKASVVDLQTLGFTDHNLEIILKNLKKPHGMFLVTGPTGSGKSTTLYSVLTELNKENINIVTLEDPVEYSVPGVSQTQIHPEIGLSFANGLRSILRQDPDVVMVGEIRDNDTAELAVHAALTGHMVLSTLHTNNALGAIPRLTDMKVEPFLVSSALNVVIAQRLVRKICDHCKVKIDLPPSMEREVVDTIRQIPTRHLPRDIPTQPPFSFWRGQGCMRCEDTGYKGRVAITEVIEATPTLQQMIAFEEIGNLAKVEAELQQQGMIYMRQDGVIKALRGATTIEEVWGATKE